jgi:hypothetical protein
VSRALQNSTQRSALSCSTVSAAEYRSFTGLDKFPCVKWKQFQTVRPTTEQLRQWDRKFHPERWGPVTGKLSGIVVADFDGEASRELMEKWEIVPHVRTGSGGFHAYVKHPGWQVPTFNAKSGKRRWPWPSLDIRGDGGFAETGN